MISKNIINLQQSLGQAKADLRRSDYKIIKCMEAFLCEEELPYDIAKLHLERNELRGEINNIEIILNENYTDI